MDARIEKVIAAFDRVNNSEDLINCVDAALSQKLFIVQAYMRASKRVAEIEEGGGEIQSRNGYQTPRNQNQYNSGGNKRKQGMNGYDGAILNGGNQQHANNEQQPYTVAQLLRKIQEEKQIAKSPNGIQSF